jgi:hypothetical protein
MDAVDIRRPAAAQRVVLATGACTKPRIPELVRSGHVQTAVDPFVAVPQSEPISRAARPGGRSGQFGRRNRRRPGRDPRRDRRDGRAHTPRHPASRHSRRPDAAGRHCFAIRTAGIVNPLGAALRRMTVPDLSGYGLPRPKAPYSQFQRTGTVPVLDHGFVAAVRSGAITIRTADGPRRPRRDPRRRVPILPRRRGRRDRLHERTASHSWPARAARRSRPAAYRLAGRSRAAGLYTVGISIPCPGCSERSPSTSAAWFGRSLADGRTMGHDGHRWSPRTGGASAEHRLGG